MWTQLTRLQPKTRGHPNSPSLSLDNKGDMYREKHTAPQCGIPGPHPGSAPSLWSQTCHFLTHTRGRLTCKRKCWVTFQCPFCSGRALADSFPFSAPIPHLLAPPHQLLHPPSPPPSSLAVPSEPPGQLGLSVIEVGPPFPPPQGPWAGAQLQREVTSCLVCSSLSQVPHGLKGLADGQSWGHHSRACLV